MEIAGTKEEVLRGVERLRSISASATSTGRCTSNSTLGVDLGNVVPSKMDGGCLRPNVPVQLELLPLRPTSLRALPLSTVVPAPATPFLWHLLGPGNPSKYAPKLIDMNVIPSAADSDDADEPSPTAFSSLPRDSIRGTECRLDLKREREMACDAEERERTCEVTSRGSDEEEIGQTRKKLRLTKEQSGLLEDSFRIHSTLNPKQKNSLAKQLNLRPRQVEVWFQNRRARTKLKQTEVDCELLKRCCESLTEENKRLQKELRELRAVKVASPCVVAPEYYMPLPAATLTMCPSCERLGTMDKRSLRFGKPQFPQFSQPSAAC